MRPQTVLTTGASSGIGLATVLEVAAAGHRSIATVRSDAKAETVARAAEERGVEVETRQLDVTDADRCAAVIADVRPDVLVNNAGRALFGAVECVPEEDVRALFETLLFGPVRLARLALPHMRERGRGRVIFMSSLFGRVSAPPLGWYASAKHAIEGVADALRMEVARDGIDVVVIEPGGVRSSLLEDAARESARYESDRYARAHERAREGLRWTDFLRAEPRSVARVVVRAIDARSPEARYLVGYDAQIIGRLSPMLPDWLTDRVTRAVQGL
jgi:NAD(P)-dependent dehydrogenase (short-subunit alcohol dehydrogenase family)